MKRIPAPLVALTALAASQLFGQTVTSSSATTSQLAAETAARIAADTTNANAITAEASARSTGDATNATAIADEAAARIAADALKANLTANVFSEPQTAPAWLLDTTNKVLRSGSNSLTSADNGKSIYLSTSGSTQTLPADLPFGFRCSLYNTSAGDITLSIAGGVSVNGSSSSITLAPKTKLELTPTVDGGGGVVAFRAIASREPLAASTIWGRSSTGGASEKTVTDFGFSLLDDPDAPTAQATLGGTTVGRAFFTAANPSAVAFPRVNADNSVTYRTGSELLSDIGGAPTSSPTFTGIANAVTIAADAYQSNASRVTSVTSSASIANADNGKLLNVTGTNAVVLTVPSGLTAGMRFEVSNNTTGSGSVTLAVSSTTLNGSTTSIVLPRICKAVVEYTASNAYQVSLVSQRPGVPALRTVLPPADYTSASGANQCWLTELWAIPAQTNGLASDNTRPAYIAKGNFVINSTIAGKQASLQILPATNLVGGSINGFISSGGGLRGDVVFNMHAGVVDVLTNTNQNRLKVCGSGAFSRKLRYKFSTNFAANAGDVIVMSPSGHTFVVDDTITDATVWTDATTGGVSVRQVNGGGTPTTSDTSLTVNGGAPITTTYVSNTATNSGTFPNSVLFASSTGIHVMSAVFGDFGFFVFTLI